jgi:LemA protein
MKKTAWIGVAGFVVLVGFAVAGGYNRLVRLQQGVEAQWAQVENTYQRRADLIPNLVATVKGSAKFEQDTLREVTEARARVGQVQPTPASGPAAGGAPTDPAALQKFQQAQDQLSGALSRLLVVVERYPELKSTAAFRDLQAQLEGTENRISVERMRFNEVARAYNAARSSFPTVLVANLFGARFAPKAYFQAQSGADTAPKVQF